MRSITVTVTEAQGGCTVKALLHRELHMADIQISRLKLRETGILLNGRRVFTNARVRPGDVLTVEVGDEAGRNGAEPLCAPLEVVYEDEDLLVINKAPDMAVHGSTGGSGCTVANAMAYRYGPEQAFHPANRLDRGTSGLMVIAKSAYVHDQLRRMLHTEDFIREYLAMAEGIIVPTEGRITLPIGRDPASPTKRAILPEGQPSETGYRVVEQKKEGALLRVRPFTGRTHQIRVHTAAVGHPLFGDSLYGHGAREGLARPALHSAFLALRHPVTGERLLLTAPLPADLSAFWDDLP